MYLLLGRRVIFRHVTDDGCGISNYMSFPRLRTGGSRSFFVLFLLGPLNRFAETRVRIFVGHCRQLRWSLTKFGACCPMGVSKPQ